MNTETNTEYFFLLDERVNFGMVFASAEMLKLEGEKAPLWGFRFPSDDHRLAMCAWVGARRDQWPAWGQLAEKIGTKAFARHLHALTVKEPLEAPNGVMLHPCDDACELEISTLLGGLIVQPILRHRFNSPSARRRFLSWFYTGDNHHSAWSLAMVGWLDGPSALAKVLDGIAASEMKQAA